MRRVPLAVLTWCFISIPLFAQTFLWPIYIEDSGYDHVTQYWLMILVAFLEVPVVLLLLFVIDLPGEGSSEVGDLPSPASQLVLKFSRRSILFILMVLSVLWVFLHTFLRKLGPGWMVLGNAGMRILALGPYEVMYVYMAELMPTSHRNTGLALGNGATKTVAGMLPLVLLPLMHIDDFAPLVLICVCTFLAAVLIWVRQKRKKRYSVKTEPRTLCRTSSSIVSDCIIFVFS